MATATTYGAPGVSDDRFSRYFTIALAVHALAIAVIAFMPSDWLGRADDDDRDVMMISLGGTPGEATTGLRSIDARAVQQATPDPVPPQFRAPAEKPVMAIPEKPVEVKKPTPPPPATKTPIQTTQTPISKTPIRGTEVREGQARVDTGAKVSGDGLQLGGGGTGGETNLSNFCCPEYLKAMSAAIRRNWRQNQGVAGVNTVRFTIERDGRVTGVELVERSGQFTLDRESQAVLLNARVPPLPPEFKEPKLIIRMTFEYR